MQKVTTTLPTMAGSLAAVKRQKTQGKGKNDDSRRQTFR